MADPALLPDGQRPECIDFALPTPRERNNSIFWSTSTDIAKSSSAPLEHQIPACLDDQLSDQRPRPDHSQNGESVTTEDTPAPQAEARPMLEKMTTVQPSRRIPPRPSALRKYQTDVGQVGEGQLPPSPPPPTLNRSRGSYLNAAIWQRIDDEYSSSSSSDEDEDTAPAPSDLTRTQTQLDRERLTAERVIGGDEERRGSKDTDEDDNERRKAAQKQRKDTLLSGADADDRYRRFLVGNENYQSKGKIKKDGRLQITVNETAGTGYIAKALGAAMDKMVPVRSSEETTTRPSISRLSSTSTFASADIGPKPRLNIVIMVIGSRGDVQPFLKVGKILKEDYGHRVRIATHPTFRDYVERDSGLEFFSVGGDPSELMAFMVKNPGMIPTLETVRAGEIGKRRAAMAEMFGGFWRACINATDDEKDHENLKMMGIKDPFVADAIIANPPSFAHVHCAEALGIPLHLMFTFPYTPTQAFPHPLANIKRSNIDPGYTNFISYPMVEMMIWQGLGDLINDFRVKTLALDPVSTLWAPGATYRLHVPFTYLWSPGLVPKPRDWGDYIDISGFVYLDLASSFTPPSDLEEFLAKGEPPVYIGFGSIVVDDADRFTQMIYQAVEQAGVRALISRGWGGFGGQDAPENIFMLDNTPHDWLFPKVRACVIHGGAGTTAIALKCGLPTMVVPFFGDQHFWGKMVGSSGVGPPPVPYKYLSADNLADGIKYLLTDKAKEAARTIANSIEREGDGARNAVKAFHRHLNLQGSNSMRCSLLKNQIASWQPKGTHVRLSPLAADILSDCGFISWRKLRLLRHMEWNDFEGPGEPVTGVAGSIVTSMGNAFKGVAGVPYRLAKTTKKNKRRLHRKKEIRLSAQNSAASRQNANGSTITHSISNETGAMPADVAIEGIQQDVTTADLQHAMSMERTTTADIQDEYIGDVAAGVGLTAAAIAKAPMNLSLALAQGFHNAPRLYGDDTVRKPTRITGIHSGLRAARKEFVYGVYDGFTGVVRLPIRGAKSDGVSGFVKGTGMGLVGLVLKNLAAVIGPVGYTAKGIMKQAERSRTPTHFIRRARIAQGQRELKALSPTEREEMERDVIEAFHTMKDLCEAITHKERQRGLAGHIDRVFLDTGILFNDVDAARRAMRALEKGDSLESIIAAEKAENALKEKMRQSKNKSGSDETRTGSNVVGMNGKTAWSGRRSRLGGRSGNEIQSISEDDLNMNGTTGSTTTTSMNGYWETDGIGMNMNGSQGMKGATLNKSPNGTEKQKFKELGRMNGQTKAAQVVV